MVVQSPEQLFDLFVAAKNQEDVLKYFAGLKRHVVSTQTNNDLSSPRCITFYRCLTQCIKSWRAQSIWKILDERVNHPVYEGNVICEGARMLVIGAGPIGLRMAIECAFLGGDTHIIEKRASATRNNILHLWPFTIDDLRRLGAKKFYGQFCAGAIDHISIRQLQIILLKICCILGVHVHVGVEFRGLEEPCTDKSGKCSGWGINVVPHPALLPKWRWDAIVQASGRQHVLPLFQYKEFRGQQAIGMTVNFVNRGTMEELTIEEISGIAFIYNQEFFNGMYEELGIALENIVYYKDETHYFVMSTKKQSLLHKKVLKKDYPTTSELLSPDNIDYGKAQQFVREVAGFATNLPVLDLMTNHHDKADVAIFDFSAIKIAANSARVLERHGQRLIMCLVGDSLLEPFWPQGTGCARGFLSVQNSAWMFKKYFRGVQIYEVLRERESLFKLLAQSSPLKLNSKHDKYTIDPSTRYNYWTVSAEQFEVFHLYNRGETPIINNYSTQTPATTTDVRSRRRTREDRRKTIQVTINRSYSRDHDEKEGNSPTTPTLEQGSLLNWSRESTCGYRGVRVTNLTTSWKSGLAFAALIHRYRPDLLNFISVSTKNPEQILKAVFDTTHREFGIKSPFTSKELASTSIPDRHRIIMYLTALHSHFTSEASKSLQISPDMCYFCSRHITPEQLTSSHSIKFHSSCLKCEHCLDKISLNTLHFVDERMSDEYAKRRKSGYPDCKSGFYCKFHFREYFTSKSSSLHTKNWLESKGTEFISSTEPSSTPPPSTGPLPQEPHSDTEEDKVVLRETSHELRRAKSAASVRSLRDMFESISTGSPQGVGSEERPEVELVNGNLNHLKNVHKSSSFSGLLPGTRSERSETEGSKAGLVSPTIPPKPKTAKKKKSGVAKKIERRQESGKGRQESGKASAKPNLSKIDNNAVLCEAGVDQSLPSDLIAISRKKKSRFKLFKKKKPSSSSNIPPSPVVTSNSESNLDDTSSLVISNKSDHALTTSTDSKCLNKSGLPKSDPLYTIVNPEYKPESRDDIEFDSLSDTTSTSSFIRNSVVRRTAPPKMNRGISDDTEEIVDSNSCRRPSQIVQNVSREALVLQTNSPHARSLLRNSMRNAAAFVKQNLNFQDQDTLSLPSTPKSSRILIARTSSAQALLNPASDVPASEAHVISKAFYSPKPKRAQKVKLDNVELKESPLKPQLTAEATIVHRKSCSPLPQRSKKVRLSMSRRSPLNLSIDSSSDEEDIPPGRPELPKNLDFLLATNKPNENGFKHDVVEEDALPGRKISLGFSISTPSMTSALPAARNNNTDNLSSCMKSESCDHRKNNLLSNSLTRSDSSHSSSADVFETKTSSGMHRTFKYAKRVPEDNPLQDTPLEKRESLEGSGLTSDCSEYHTPGTHGSTPSQEVFYTPDQSLTGSTTRRSSAPTPTVPAKRPSEATVSGSSKRSSVALDEVFDQGTAEEVETANTTPIITSFVERPSHLRLDAPSRRDKPPVRRAVSTTENKVNRVLDENMSSKDHSSINKILAKYRRIPSTQFDATGKGKISETTKDKPKRSISERQTSKLSSSGPPAERKSSAGPQHRVKMIAHLSNSFDKTIDRLVNKYYPRKDTPSRDVSGDSSASSRDSARHTGSDESNSKTSLLSRDSQKSYDSSRGTDRKSSESGPTRDYKRRLSQDPGRGSSYEGIKRHPSTPSRYYSYKSGNSPRGSKSSSSSQDNKSGDNSGNSPPVRGIIKTTRDSISDTPTTAHEVIRARQSSEGSSSTISRDSIRQMPVTPAKAGSVPITPAKASSVPITPAKEGTMSVTPTKEGNINVSKGRTALSRDGGRQSSVQPRDGAKLSSPTTTPLTTTPLTTTPLTTLSRDTSLNTPAPARSVAAQKLRHNRNRRVQSVNTPSSCECRSVPHTPTCKGYRSHDNGKKSRDGTKVRDSTEEESENIAYVDLHDGSERLRQWDKKDYSRYLKSLRYQGSVVSRKDSFNVKNTVQAFQRKETDV